MTSVQLLLRLCRFLTIKDPALLPSDDAIGVADAMNAAIQEYYQLVPSAYKGTTLSGTLLPAQTITATFTQGSNVFSGWSAQIGGDGSQKGFTIVCGSDTRQNTIVGPNEMLDIYTGQTGTFTAQVYGDCLQMENVIERFTNDPILVDYNRRVIRDETWRQRAVTGVWSGPFQPFIYGSYSSRQIRVPDRYWIESQGESQGAYPPFILRMNTLPDVEYRVRIEGLLAPVQVSYTNLTVPVNLALDPYVVENTVLPIAAYKLRTHPLWRDKELWPAVKEDYAEARDACKMRPSDLGSTTHVVGTPRGY